MTPSIAITYYLLLILPMMLYIMSLCENWLTISQGRFPRLRVAIIRLRPWLPVVAVAWPVTIFFMVPATIAMIVFLIRNPDVGGFRG